MGSNDPKRWSSGPRGESGRDVEASGATTADAGGWPRIGRRRFVGGALAAGIALPGVASADGGGTNVNVEFVDCVTVELTGDVGEITGLHFYVWNAVDVVDDHLTVEDVSSLEPGTTLPNGLRVTEHDPDAGVLGFALNTVAYNLLSTANVYVNGPPEPFGDNPDFTGDNSLVGDVALTDVSQDGGTYDDGAVVSADVHLANVSDEQRTVFVGYSAVGPDGLAYNNGGTTGTTVTLAPGSNVTETVSWDVESDAPDGDYDAHVAVWRQSDPDHLQTRYDERYLHDAFAVGGTVDASIAGTSLPGGTYTDGETVATDVTVENTGTGEHTFFVGYSVIGPDDLAYTNGGTTGTPLALSSGETDTATVDWTVESDAPSGTYGVHVAVWAESDPDDLQTKLDEEIHDAVFEVA